jgi:hypothetical protein
MSVNDSSTGSKNFAKGPLSDPLVRRIETQIHRRKKAKATLPLESEWDEGSPTPPDLKMPSDRLHRSRMR